MRLSPPLKILVGILALVFAVIPFILIGSMATLFLGLSADPGDSSFPSTFLESAMPAFMALACILNILQYGLVAFYVTHIVLNNSASDVVRIILALGVFFMPYIGMPPCFILYILISSPPAWVLKPQPLPNSHPRVGATATGRGEEPPHTSVSAAPTVGTTRTIGSPNPTHAGIRQVGFARAEEAGPLTEGIRQPAGETQFAGLDIGA